MALDGMEIKADPFRPLYDHTPSANGKYAVISGAARNTIV
jgi:hypothetical protein